MISRSWTRGLVRYSYTVVRPHLHLHCTSHPKRAARLQIRPLLIANCHQDGWCLGQILGGDLPRLGFMFPAKRDAVQLGTWGFVPNTAPLAKGGYQRREKINSIMQVMKMIPIM